MEQARVQHKLVSTKVRAGAGLVWATAPAGVHEDQAFSPFSSFLFSTSLKSVILYFSMPYQLFFLPFPQNVPSEKTTVCRLVDLS